MATQSQAQFELNSSSRQEDLCHYAYDCHRQRLSTLCQWLTPDAPQARQLEMAVFVDAWSKLPAGGEGRGGAGYHDQLAESLATRFEPLFHTDAATEAEEARAAGPQLVAPAQPRLRAALRALPLRHRLVYLLHELEGYPAGRLAHWLNLDRQHCARLIHEARLRLRQSLLAA